MLLLPHLLLPVHRSVSDPKPPDFDNKKSPGERMTEPILVSVNKGKSVGRGTKVLGTYDWERNSVPTAEQLKPLADQAPPRAIRLFTEALRLNPSEVAEAAFRRKRRYRFKGKSRIINPQDSFTVQPSHVTEPEGFRFMSKFNTRTMLMFTHGQMVPAHRHGYDDPGVFFVEAAAVVAPFQCEPPIFQTIRTPVQTVEQAEICAVAWALKKVVSENEGFHTIVVATDCQYLIDRVCKSDHYLSHRSENRCDGKELNHHDWMVLVAELERLGRLGLYVMFCQITPENNGARKAIMMRGNRGQTLNLMGLLNPFEKASVSRNQSFGEAPPSQFQKTNPPPIGPRRSSILNDLARRFTTENNDWARNIQGSINQITGKLQQVDLQSGKTGEQSATSQHNTTLDQTLMGQKSLTAQMGSNTTSSSIARRQMAISELRLEATKRQQLPMSLIPGPLTRQPLKPSIDLSTPASWRSQSNAAQLQQPTTDQLLSMDQEPGVSQFQQSPADQQQRSMGLSAHTSDSPRNDNTDANASSYSLEEGSNGVARIGHDLQKVDSHQTTPTINAQETASIVSVGSTGSDTDAINPNSSSDSIRDQPCDVDAMEDPDDTCIGQPASAIQSNRDVAECAPQNNEREKSDADEAKRRSVVLESPGAMEISPTRRTPSHLQPPAPVAHSSSSTDSSDTENSDDRQSSSTEEDTVMRSDVSSGSEEENQNPTAQKGNRMGRPGTTGVVAVPRRRWSEGMKDIF